MRKLHLLKPNLVKGFLNSGMGQSVEYLRVPQELTLEALEADVNAGAVAYKEVLENAKKKISRIVLIRSDNKENGLMAANYLAGICNELDGYVEDDDEFELTLEDEYDIANVLDEYVDLDEDDDMESGWRESASRLPIIDAESLFRYSNSTQEYFMGGFASVGLPNMRNEKPYWMECNKEAVCVFVPNAPGVFNFFSRLNVALERFINNKRVFIVIVDRLNQEDEFGMIDNYMEQEELEFVLENTADLFVVTAKEDDLKKYRLAQFEDWAKCLGVKLGKKFPKNEIVEKIVSLKSPEKSAMMEKVLLYVLKESQKGTGDELTKEDFAVLKKFKVLITEEKKEKINAMKLEKELIGMEAVKEQVKSIVEVMKYNKLREKMGLQRACFHNAHLLIGAPGTAKTTVAQLLGAMMCEENLLPGDRYICVNGADLKGKYVGHSAPKTHEIFENHDVIVIDEAYSLTAEDGYGGVDSFSQEAIAQLILEIENHPMDKLILFAGYGGVNVSEKNNKMKQFIDANPGLKSRINSTIYFDSYTPEQMVDIVHIQAKNQKLELDSLADQSMIEFFKLRVKDQNFGNGREARSLLENAMVFAAKRVMSLPAKKRTKRAMSLITKEDIDHAILRMKEGHEMQIGKQKSKTGFAV